MTAVEHMIAWIESSYPHYQRLLQLEQTRKSAGKSLNGHVASEAVSIVASAYREATRGGDMFAEDQSPEALLDAARALLSWELEDTGDEPDLGAVARNGMA